MFLCRKRYWLLSIHSEIFINQTWLLGIQPFLSKYSGTAKVSDHLPTALSTPPKLAIPPTSRSPTHRSLISVESRVSPLLSLPKHYKYVHQYVLIGALFALLAAGSASSMPILVQSLLSLKRWLVGHVARFNANIPRSLSLRLNSLFYKRISESKTSRYHGLAVQRNLTKLIVIDFSKRFMVILELRTKTFWRKSIIKLKGILFDAF